jgi:hypothetical protein
VHCPFTGALTVTDVAVIGADDEDVVPDAAVAVMQSPALTATTVVLTWWVNLVEVVQLTATWPLCWFCTCIVVPVIAAIVPNVPGRFAPPKPPPLPVPPLGATAAGDVLEPPPLPLPDDEPPPHAVSTSAPTMAVAAPPIGLRRLQTTRLIM